MTGNRNGNAAGQSRIYKMATLAIIVLVFGVAYIIQKEMRQTGGAAVSYVKPIQPDFPAVKKLPPREGPGPAPIQPPPEIQPRFEAPAPRITSPAVPTKLPPVPASAPEPIQGLRPAAGIQTLPAPVTEVHPLSDAEEVMGAPSSEVGEIGVTRTYKLPDQEWQDEILPLPND